MPYHLPHPEAAPGEVWYCNVAEGDATRQPFTSARRGAVAYGHDDQPREGFRPVFVTAAELEAKDIALAEVRRAMEAAAAATIARRLHTPDSKKGRAMKARNKRIADDNAKREARMQGAHA